ncbi:MAG: hypothetical protein HUU10_14060 [Bacteroidetes bacterium]|nr:hypothetical protein [Bacteroidota bacterium]
MNRFLLLALSGLFPALPLFAQFGTWSNTFSPYAATSGVMAGPDLILGTEAGLVILKNGDPGQISFLSGTEGLNSTGITALAWDSLRQEVIAGFQNGDLLFFSPQSGAKRVVSDIRMSTVYEKKQITRLVIDGDMLYIGTGFGFVTYRLTTRLFIIDVSRIRLISSFEGRDFLRRNGLLWVATSQGLFFTPETNPNLKNPDSWTAVSQLNNQDVVRLMSWDTLLVALSPQGTGIIRSGVHSIPSWATDTRLAGKTGRDAARLPDGSLVILNSAGLTRLLPDRSIVTHHAFSNGEFLISQRDSLYLFRASTGLFSVTGSGLTPLYLNGIGFNSFHDLVDDGGWFGGSAGKFGTSITLNDGSGFFTVDQATFPAIRGNAGYLGMETDGNRVLIGTWGSGVISVWSRDSVGVYGSQNSGLSGIAGDPNYVVVLDINRDAAGNLWMLNAFTADQYPLKVKPAGQDWSAVTSLRYPGNPAYDFSKHWVDPSGLHWFEVWDAQSQPSVGLYVLDPKGTPAKTSDDQWKLLTTRSGSGSLPSTIINDIAFDGNGSAWIATPGGLSVLYGANYLTSQSGPIDSQPVYAVQGQSVRAVAIDASGRKWLSLVGGLTVLSPDGDQVEAMYHTGNSPLLSNSISRLFYRGSTGEMICLTDRGLSVLSTGVLQPEDKPTGPTIYPNPFIRGKHSSVWISGASANSDVMILGLDGTVFRRIPSAGSGTIRWDGLDDQGRPLGSGFYLVAIRDTGKGTSAIGKMAIIE